MTLNGASNTLEVLNFFYEASQFTQPDGNPILECGDVIVSVIKVVLLCERCCSYVARALV